MTHLANFKRGLTPEILNAHSQTLQGIQERMLKLDPLPSEETNVVLAFDIEKLAAILQAVIEDLQQTKGTQ